MRGGMRKGTRRVVTGALLVVLAVGVIVGYRAYQVYSDLNSFTARFPTLAGEPKATPVTSLLGRQRINILVLGSDNDRKIQEKRPLTQSMIVVSIDPVHNKVNLLSIPRDLYVNIPGFGMDKIDVAAKDGGISLARATVERVLGRKIDYTAWIGLEGFRDVIDTFGGLTVNVLHPIVDDFYPDDTRPGNPYAYTRIFIPAGWRHMSGRQALQYVRSRHADAVGDFGRSARQQELLLALRRKANGWSLLFKIPDIARELRGKVRTDLSLRQVLDLARLSRRIQMNQIHRYVLQAPTYSTYGTSAKSGSILIPKWKAIKPLLARVFAPVKESPAPPPAKRVISRGRGAPAPTARPTPPISSPTPTPLPTHPPAVIPLPRLPGRLLYGAGGTFYVMQRNRQTRSLFGSRVGAYMNAAAMPALSPNGRDVVFVRYARYATDLFRYRIGSEGNPVRLTRDRTYDQTNVHDNVWAAFPSWAGNGRTLLFASDAYKRATPPSETRQIDLAIYAMDPNGGAARQVTQPALGAGGDTDPQWRGTGTQFLYDHWAYRTASTPQGVLAVGQPYSQLAVRDINNPNAVWYLTPPRGQVVQPTIDRSGRRVAYVRTVSTTSSNLVVARIVDTARGPRLRNQRMVTSGQVAQPAFSPDGRWLSFLRADGDGFSLWLVPVSGGRPVKLTQAGRGLDALSRPIWFP